MTIIAGSELGTFPVDPAILKQIFTFKAAFYRVDLCSEDTDKLMIYTTFGF